MSANDHFAHAIDIARDGLKALVLVNAGAASAFVALTDKTDQGHDYTFPVLLFGVGTLLSVLAYVIAYLSQLSYANHCLAVEKGEDGSQELARHGRFQSLAFQFVIAAVLFAILGMGSAFLAARPQ